MGGSWNSSWYVIVCEFLVLSLRSTTLDIVICLFVDLGPGIVFPSPDPIARSHRPIYPLLWKSRCTKNNYDNYNYKSWFIAAESLISKSPFKCRISVTSKTDLDEIPLWVINFLFFVFLLLNHDRPTSQEKAIENETFYEEGLRIVKEISKSNKSKK